MALTWWSDKREEPGEGFFLKDDQGLVDVAYVGRRFLGNALKVPPGKWGVRVRTKNPDLFLAGIFDTAEEAKAWAVAIYRMEHSE